MGILIPLMSVKATAAGWLSIETGSKGLQPAWSLLESLKLTNWHTILHIYFNLIQTKSEVWKQLESWLAQR